MCTKKQVPHEKPTKVITRVSRFEWLTIFCTATTSLYMNNSRSGHQVEGIIMKLFVVVVDVVVVVVVVVFLTETNDTTKRVDLQPSKFCPPRRRRLLSQEGIGFYKALIVGLISVGLHHLWLCLWEYIF